ncbi:MAG: hypothetical protein D6790_01885, partial [Caldilineae bacterium]
MATSVETSADRTLEVAERIVSGGVRGSSRFSLTVLLAYLILSIGAVMMVIPFVWMVLTSLKPAPELVQFAFLPKNPTLENYLNVLTTSNFER